MTAASISIAISVTGLVISVTGWIVVHLLAIRTQKLALINSIRNEARLEITRRIHEFHACCNEIQSASSLAFMDDSLLAAGVDNQYRARANRIRELCTDERLLIWLRTLEEYELLFPEATSVRIQLLHRSNQAFAEMRSIANRYENDMVETRTRELDAYASEFWDLVALTWDLLIYVQNKCIGNLVGMQIPGRQVTSPELPRITPKANGQLEIVAGA